MSAAAMPGLGGQLLRYGATGLLNTALGLTVIFALHLALGVNLIAANAAGYAAGWLVSFALNRSWTFRHDGPVPRGLLLYLLLVLVAFSANIILIKGLLVAGLPYGLAQTAGVVLYSGLVFAGARHVVFAPSR